ncbi:MAG: OmpA family protein [Alistipes sp.]|nr:OmpA family protein [Alistipes sp.]
MLHGRTAKFGSQISGAAALYAGYQFTPVAGIRFGFTGWENRSAASIHALPNGTDGKDNVYRWNYLGLNLDATIDLANWFGGFNHKRTVNPYIFAGVGLNEAFNNDQLVELSRNMSRDAADENGTPYYDMDKTLWEGPELFVALRMGAGVDFRLSDRVLLGLELNTNMLSDAYDSRRHSSRVDWQMNALASLRIRLAKNHTNSGGAAMANAPVTSPVTEPAPEPEPAPAPAPKPAPAPAPKPAPQPEVQPAVTPAPAPVEKKEPAPVKKTEPAPAPKASMHTDIFFTIGSANASPAESAKIDKLAKFLKEHPKAKVSVTGYGDAATGSARRNMVVSRMRADNVAAALRRAGIENDRIKVDAKGATVQPYSPVEKNRVAICVAEE